MAHKNLHTKLCMLTVPLMQPFQYLFHEIPLVILPFQTSDQSKGFTRDFKYDQSNPIKQATMDALLSLRQGLEYDEQVIKSIKTNQILSYQTNDKGCIAHPATKSSAWSSILLHGFQTDQPVIKSIKTNQILSNKRQRLHALLILLQFSNWSTINQINQDQSNPIKQATKAVCIAHPAARFSNWSTSNQINQDQSILSNKR